MKAVFGSDVGKQRRHNEDSVNVFYNQHQLLGVVADGMGGHAAGEVASGMALAFVAEKWRALDRALTEGEAVDWLNHLVRAVNVHLYDYSQVHEDCHGMGTTFAAVFCSEQFMVVTTVGDSRVYSWCSGIRIRQMTEDHTLVNELVKSGQISRADADSHPEKHVLMRALGTEPAIALDTFARDWNETSHLIICSDGLTNKLSDAMIASIMESSGTLDDKIEKMIAAANEAGGEDNISLIIISHDPDGDGK
ncbi:MAG: Stp1/IreP family PP2C-type Ser/Thr phosphatase [Sporolactobacillus sp.]